MTRNFLVVAAESRVREKLVSSLVTRGYSVTRAASGAEAKRVVGSVAVDVVVIEAHLPDTTADQLVKRIRRDRPDCRVIVVNSFGRVRNTPEQLRFGDDELLIDVEQFGALVRDRVAPSHERAAEPISLRGRDALLGVIDVLVGLLELDDRFFGGSSHAAMKLAREVAVELSADDETVTEIVLATLLRDIGKVDIEPEILSADGVYTEQQREKMREHVFASLRLLEHIDFPWKVLPVIRHHHEHYDGGGYPDGLAGRQIPLGARIVAAVDAHQALTSNREYRQALPPGDAMARLIAQTGRQFDPEVVEGLQKVLDRRGAAAGRSGAVSVLVVGAGADVRRLLKMHLLNDGVEVLEKDNLDGALESVVTECPDLILVDLDDSPDEAFLLLGEIRSDPALCRLPFAFFSRRRDRGVRIRALREGVDDFLSKDADLDETVARIQNILTREAVRRDGTPAPARRGITGELENLALPDIVQMLAMGMKSARVTLKTDAGQGRIWFDGGRIRHATAGKRAGEEAVMHMVGWESGRFVIEHGVHTRKTTVEQDPMFLVMEGLRRIDEARAAS